VSATIPFAGYAKLRPGRIHLYCPRCGRRQSNAHRSEVYDPPDAVLAHIWCCGDTDGPPRYLDADGAVIDYWAWFENKPEAHPSAARRDGEG
jgi:hypothetical protein